MSRIASRELENRCKRGREEIHFLLCGIREAGCPQLRVPLVTHETENGEGGGGGGGGAGAVGVVWAALFSQNVCRWSRMESSLFSGHQLEKNPVRFLKALDVQMRSAMVQPCGWAAALCWFME